MEKHSQHTTASDFKDAGEGRSGANATSMHHMNMPSLGNDSSPPHIASFNTSLFFYTVSGYMQKAFTLTSILFILPLSIFVLYLGHQQWRRQRAVSTASIMSHSDIFTYNMAVMELIGVLGSFISCYGTFANHQKMELVGLKTWIFTWNGQMLFPLAICVDRYLAVVHPITYLRLRQRRGVMIRNITTGYIWVQCFGELGFSFLIQKHGQFLFLLGICYMAVFLIIMSFCCLSVLCVLIRPRPGVVGSRVDKSKQRAFHTILIIMGVLLLRFGGNLICNMISFSPLLSYSAQNMLKISSSWFSLPSSLVLPLLFLHRAGKLECCKHTTESG